MSTQPTGKPEHPPAAIVSLIMGIVGLVALPLIGSIIGLVFGYQSRSAVERDPHRYTDDLGRIGRVLSWIGLALYGVGLLLALLAVVLFVAV